MNPNRVMRLQLTPDGRGIAGIAPLEANKPELTFPTLGTLAGDTFYFIANSQKGNYDRFGLLKDKNKLEGTRIYQVEANYKLPQQQPKLPADLQRKVDEVQGKAPAGE